MNSRLFHEDEKNAIDPSELPLEIGQTEYMPSDDVYTTTIIDSAYSQSPPHIETLPDPLPELSEIHIKKEDTDLESKKSRLRQKIERTKQKYPEKTKLISKEKETNSELSKKQLQLVRNRISAQKSRDRKKQELVELANKNSELLQENTSLKNTLANVQNEIQVHNKTLEIMNETARNEYNRARNLILNELNINEAESHGHNGIRFGNPLILASLLIIGVMCIIGTISMNSYSTNFAAPVLSTDLVPSRRLLSSEPKNPDILPIKTNSEYPISELLYF